MYTACYEGISGPILTIILLPRPQALTVKSRFHGGYGTYKTVQDRLRGGCGSYKTVKATFPVEHRRVIQQGNGLNSGKSSPRYRLQGYLAHKKQHPPPRTTI